MPFGRMRVAYRSLTRSREATQALIAAARPACKQTPPTDAPAAPSRLVLRPAAGDLGRRCSGTRSGRGWAATRALPTRPPRPARSPRAALAAADDLTWPSVPTGGHPHDRCVHLAPRAAPKARSGCPPRTLDGAGRPGKSQPSWASPSPRATPDNEGPGYRTGGTPALPSLARPAIGYRAVGRRPAMTGFGRASGDVCREEPMDHRKPENRREDP